MKGLRGCGSRFSASKKRVQGSGFRGKDADFCRVKDARCKVQGAGCRVQGAGCWVQGAGCRVRGAGCRVQGAGCRVQGAGCRVQGCGRRAHPRDAVSKALGVREDGHGRLGPHDVGVGREVAHAVHARVDPRLPPRVHAW